METNQANISTSIVLEEASTNDLLLHRFRLRAWRRIEWLRHIWQQTTVQNEILGAYHQEIDRILLQLDTLPAEYEWYQNTATLQDLNKEIQAVETVLSKDNKSRFFLLKQIFGLNEEEADMLQSCLAVSLDPSLSRVCAYLQDQINRTYITNELVARLFGHSLFLWISPESPLKIWRLVQETVTHLGEPPSYRIDSHIQSWLMGLNELDEQLISLCYLHTPRPPLPSWPIEQAVAIFTKHIQSNVSRGARIQISGISGSGRKTFAACVAEQLEMPLLVIATDNIPSAFWETLCIHVYRQAFLDRCAIAWSGKNLKERIWPSYLAPFQIQFAICEEGQDIGSEAGVIDYQITLPDLKLEETQVLWKQLLPQTLQWKAEEVENLLKKHYFTIGQIVSLSDQEISSIQQIEKKIALQFHHYLGNLAQPLATTFIWEDLVIGKDIRHQLRDFVFEANERRSIWEQPEIARLFPQGKGLFALLTGAPGTGKTMAAQIIAAELGLPLFRIDLSSVVSKYVGETSKNLEHILSRAKHLNIILLFDEADALFGKRTEIKDAHDRFANTDTNYLLQAIEQFPGIALLTSNQKANIDPAFIRRLRYVIDFSRPDFKQRLDIWKGLLRELLGGQQELKLKKAIEILAENIELTGAQIKLSILSAMIMAKREKQSLNMEYLIQGVEREWKKEGRGISRELRQLLHKKRSE